MGKEHNISVANRQLGDTTYFKRLDQDPTSDLQRLLNENSLKCSPQRKSVNTTSNISQSKISEQANSISSPQFTNLATLDALLSLQTITQPNGSQSLLSQDYHRMSKIPTTILPSFLQATYPKRHCLFHFMLCAYTPTYHMKTA